jgi:hypothetical protein
MEHAERMGDMINTKKKKKQTNLKCFGERRHGKYRRMGWKNLYQNINQCEAVNMTMHFCITYRKGSFESAYRLLAFQKKKKEEEEKTLHYGASWEMVRDCQPYKT